MCRHAKLPVESWILFPVINSNKLTIAPAGWIQGARAVVPLPPQAQSPCLQWFQCLLPLWLPDLGRISGRKTVQIPTLKHRLPPQDPCSLSRQGSISSLPIRAWSTNTANGPQTSPPFRPMATLSSLRQFESSLSAGPLVPFSVFSSDGELTGAQHPALAGNGAPSGALTSPGLPRFTELRLEFQCRWSTHP